MCGTTTRHALLLVAVLVVSACSGDDEPVVTTLPAQTTQATVTSTAAPPTTPAPTSPPPTTTPAPTTTPTTPPATTAPTTISGDPTFAELEQQLPPVLEGFIGAVNAAFRDPGNAALRVALAEFGTGSAVEQVNSVLDSYVEQDRFLRANPDQSSTVAPDVLSIVTVPGTGTAGMDACIVDADIMIERADDGSESVVASEPNSFFITYTFVLEGGEWFVESLDIFQEFLGQVGCG